MEIEENHETDLSDKNLANNRNHRNRSNQFGFQLTQEEASVSWWWPSCQHRQKRVIKTQKSWKIERKALTKKNNIYSGIRIEKKKKQIRIPTCVGKSE